MAWVGLDRLVKLCQKYNWNEPSLGKFKDTMHEIRHQIETYGYNSRLHSYTRELNGVELDASLLAFSLVGYCDYTSPRMLSTVESVMQHLSNSDLIYRNLNTGNGASQHEGAFVVCNFWLVENLAQSGRLDDAIRVFENTISHSARTGLLSEEIDPDSHELLGNYPQGFSHIGLINAALSIDQCLKRRKNQK
jgi:GH15 family glucan-1,4-alpha-glucosidase